MDRYRLSAVMKVETNIIANITVCPIGWTNCYTSDNVLETFKTDIIVFIGYIIMYMT
jgi:hypothetical protein